MPPTPQPTTPRPLIIVVWLSVPTNVSGSATGPAWSLRTKTPLARTSRFTWCTMPTAGGKVLHVGLSHFKAIAVPQHRFQQHADRKRQPRDGAQAEFFQLAEPVDAERAGRGTEGISRAKGIGFGHGAGSWNLGPGLCPG